MQIKLICCANKGIVLLRSFLGIKKMAHSSLLCIREIVFETFSPISPQVRYVAC